MNLQNIFIAFRNESFEKIAQLFSDQIISDKEKYLFITTCDNSVNAISNIINVSTASKNLTENDFDWLIKLYTFSCVRELHDIFDNIERSTEEIIKNSADVEFIAALNHFQSIIGGENIVDYLNNTLKFIRSSDKNTESFDQFLLGRLSPMLTFFKENDVKFDLIPPEKLLEVAQDNFNNSIKNFIKICCQ